MKQDRLFVRQGRRHFRRTYSVREAGVGVALLAVLLAVASWVAWRGAHPDPDLFELAVTDLGATTTSRGPLPDGLAAAGWRESKLSSYGPDDLYVKVNGRADFYLTFGFKQLVVATLTDQTSPTRFVDVEVFDQGTSSNAQGTYDGERPPAIESRVAADGSLHHFDRNALFLARGQYYVRAIGSEESPAIRALLEALHETLREHIAAGQRPWAHALFVDQLELPTSTISFSPEGAFSFGFARDVYIARLEDDTELFITLPPAGQSAKALATEFVEGFAGYGEPIASKHQVTWIRDRYIQTFAGATVMKSWVVGIKGAPSLDVARAQIQRLREGASALPEQTLDRARTAATPHSAADADETTTPATEVEAPAEYGGLEEQ